MATGRWVELATDRDDTICGGTIAFLDATVEAAFEFLGETPPDEVFIRYEWLEEPQVQVSLTGEGFARPLDDGILIRTDQLIDEHELVHAAQFTAWPRSARFMEEGLAVLLDSRRIYDSVRWPDYLTLDELLDDPLEAGNNYIWAWFVVSQIVHDHGVEGLRELWYEVPFGASATEVRAAYEAIFERPMDALLEPHRDRVAFNGRDLEIPEGGEEDRHPCIFSLCPGEPEVIDDVGVLFAPGPSGCEDDPHAVGPHSRNPFIDGPPVWRETIIEATEGLIEVQRPEVLEGILRPCALLCLGSGNGYGLWISPRTEDERRSAPGGRWRVEARSELEALPTDDPDAIEIRWLAP
ncbi:MAG: hypothetical protein AB1Z98_35275 [Nannocystaceae bacterium]